MTSSVGAYVQPPNPFPFGLQTSQVANFTTPSFTTPPQQWQTTRGVCSLQAPGVGTLFFRTNPNSVTWDYDLITHVDQTYGGRVIQILGAKIDNLIVKVDCGQGGWPYAMKVVQFMRDMMVTQRNGQAGTFTYTTRGWQLKVFAQNVPFHDAVQETVRELTLSFKIQEDVAGMQVAAAISAGLNALQQGIGWTNTLGYGRGINGPVPNDATGGGAATSLLTSPTSIPATALTGPPNLGIPGFASIMNFGGLGGLFGL